MTRSNPPLDTPPLPGIVGYVAIMRRVTLTIALLVLASACGGTPEVDAGEFANEQDPEPLADLTVEPPAAADAGVRPPTSDPSSTTEVLRVESADVAYAVEATPS